jgi:hypothetical protein
VTYPRQVIVVHKDLHGYWFRRYTLIGPNGKTDGQAKAGGRALSVQAARNRVADFMADHHDGLVYDYTGQMITGGGRRGAA